MIYILCFVLTQVASEAQLCCNEHAMCTATFGPVRNWINRYEVFDVIGEGGIGEVLA